MKVNINVDIYSAKVVVVTSFSEFKKLSPNADHFDKFITIEKGNDIESIITGLSKAKSMTGKEKPIAVLLHTVMGNGVDFMMHTHDWHGKAPNDDQLAVGLNQNEATLGDY